MRRRDFFALIGGAAATLPLAARGQQPAMPVIGYLYAGAPEASAHLVAAFLKGLSEGGYVEGKNVVIEYRWTRNEFDRLPELAADLVRRRVAVIAAPGSAAAAVAAKTATSTIPVVFSGGADPVQAGLVASLSHPGGNITGVTTMNAETATKRLGLLRELLPQAARFAVLVNPINALTEPFVAELRAAATVLGAQLDVFNCSSIGEINLAFARLAESQPDALVVGVDTIFFNRRVQVAILAAHYRVPAIYASREQAEVGGLMSYGSSFTDLFRQTGIYVGRVLNGERPGDLPVQRASKFEFTINLQTAKVLGLVVPPMLLARADEVIE
jgi:putative tryptophan/tyrosine transport system substrate-binding protein